MDLLDTEYVKTSPVYDVWRKVVGRKNISEFIKYHTLQGYTFTRFPHSVSMYDEDRGVGILKIELIFEKDNKEYTFSLLYTHAYTYGLIHNVYVLEDTNISERI